jgi:hypothetical protein
MGMTFTALGPKFMPRKRDVQPCTEAVDNPKTQIMPGMGVAQSRVAKPYYNS